MRVLKIGLVLMLWLFAVSARAELTFPALSGRVVDEAQMIEPSVRAQLSQQLQAHEQATGEQLVVVTLPDLQGTTIEDFGVSARPPLGHRPEGQEQRRAADRCP